MPQPPLGDLERQVELFSPFLGKARKMHLWIAARASDDGLVTVPTDHLADAAGCGRVYASVWLWQKAVPEGWLEVRVDRRNRGRASTFKVVDPELVVRSQLAG